ncbi:MAG: hypothetical protein WKF76_03825 [Nocardioidaceae bacterium]
MRRSVPMANRYRIELDRVVEVAGIIAGFPAQGSVAGCGSAVR